MEVKEIVYLKIQKELKSFRKKLSPINLCWFNDLPKSSQIEVLKHWKQLKRKHKLRGEIYKLSFSRFIKKTQTIRKYEFKIQERRSAFFKLLDD